METQFPPLVLFHGSGCRDGWAAAWIASRALRNAELVPVNYGDPPPEVAGRDVFILDFSFKRETLLALKERAKSIILLDHHVSAQKELSGLEWCTFDMSRSGAGMALDYWFPGARERGAALWFAEVALRAEDFDLWRFNYPDTKAICAYLDTLPQTLEAWNDLPLVGVMAGRGQVLLDYKAQLVERIAAQAYEIEWPEGKLLAVNSPVLQSEVGERLYGTAPAPLKASLVWYQEKTGRIRCSLRSAKDGADVSELAKSRGGGGHRNAAGFECDAL